VVEHLKTPAAPSNAPEAAKGGLLVTQNGKVIYRVPGSMPADRDASGASRLIRRVQPEYPDQAKSAHIQGPVVLEVQVLGDGTVGNIETVTGNPLLVEAAIHAVRQWKYQPNLVDGRPVQSQTRITIKFVLPSS
jgi:TonB family protein